MMRHAPILGNRQRPRTHASQWLILCACLLLCVAPLGASAATEIQDGLTARLTTDAAAYEAGGTMVMTFRLTNTNAFAVSNVRVSLTYPCGLTVLSGEPSLTYPSLAAGEAKSLSLSLRIDRPGEEEEPVPATGDDSRLLLWAGLLVLSMGGLFGPRLFGKKATRTFFAMLLCLALALPVLAPASPALAAAEQRSFFVSEVVQLSGGNMALSAVITYDWEEPGPDSDANNKRPATFR